jgi:hypothetical protein
MGGCGLRRLSLGVEWLSAGLARARFPGPRTFSSRPVLGRGRPWAASFAVRVRQMATTRRSCCHQRRRAAPTVVPPTRRRDDKSRCASARRSASRAGDGRPRRSSAHFARQANDRPKDAGPNGQRRRLGHRRFLAAARNSHIRRMFNAAGAAAATQTVHPSSRRLGQRSATAGDQRLRSPSPAIGSWCRGPRARQRVGRPTRWRRSLPP